MRELAAELAGSWRAGEPIELNTAMNRLAFDIVSRSLFDVDIPADVAQRLHDGLPLLLRASMVRAFAPSAWERLPLPAHRRYAAAVSDVRSVVDELLRQQPAGGDAGTNLVSMLRSGGDGESAEPMSPVQLRDELLNIMIAGTETTGGTLAWFFYELARHGDVQDRLYEEIDTVVGRGPVREEHLAVLRYTRCVLSETLRLHSLWLSTRRALRAVRVGGVDIPAGTELAFSLDALHRHPRIFSDPNEFRPQRWSPAAGGAVPRHAFIPFLTGSRQCVGDVFAWTEMLTVIATIAATWRLQLLPGQRIVESVTATVRPSRLTMLPVARMR
jgi:cytochrome P450